MHTSSPPAPVPPGDLLMWILILSELLVFGAGLAAFLAVRLGDPEGFAAAQAQLHRGLAGVNTLVLVTSGACAALATRAAALSRKPVARLWLLAAGALGAVFLGIKATEFRDLAALGFSTETHPFFTFYYLLTGFHAAHVAAGLPLFLIVSWRCWPAGVEMAAAFWHMVDLVWVLILPVIYLLR
ncbi:nitric oxide reductase NorE protein [Cereibacter ovatus]|uniref:Nitric oxide reductase NorE protein n=2 Tax=Cereibacter ovatus TaxID=439529 RepID=A0A285CRG2_9RHOB|nr:nitric oxide reductase NorE protein [Cereibacter ovatus]